MTIFRSSSPCNFLCCLTFLSNPRIMSVYMDYSWQSSMIKSEYLVNSGSDSISCRSVPSVSTFNCVLCVTYLSNLTAYPTCSPTACPQFWASLLATLTTETRLGRVSPICLPFLQYLPVANRSWGNFVDFPDPVSPITTVVSCFSIA